MLPKDGANVPEIRFAGFTDAWEQREAVDIFMSITDKNHQELPVLSATQEHGMILREDTGINISHDKKNEATYKRVLPGQFVIHLRSFQGGFAHSNVEGITSPAYTVMDFIEKERHYDFFWKYVFSSRKFIKSLEKVTYGIRDGRSINFDDFSTMSFLFPSCAEQKAIGQFFQNFNHLITLHQRKLEKLKNIKKSMLEKMFV
ncbi:restriction endonuclease subunit S [Bacillus pumilus]|nr:restriction endonuclease subunit S [Bacillus pumilus]PRS52411.1 restriction endonuclease subunit S [Bacillus sp. GBSC66]PRS72442.1 restriction endonuclease subunit S [Bacillus sp. NMTD17]